MSDASLSAAAEAHSTGRFREALRLLRTSAPRRGDSSHLSHQALLVEVLQLTGYFDAAETLGRSLMEHSSLPAGIQAGILRNLSQIYDYWDRADEAVDVARRAWQLAIQADDIEETCRCQLRLLALQADHDPEDVVRTQVIELRKNLYRAADAHLLVQMRLKVGQIEAKRGDTTAARQHFDCARNLLKRCPNVWLEAYLAIDTSVIAYHHSRFDEALREGERALRLAQISGHAYSTLAALDNLGLTHVSLGNFQKALEYVTKHFRLAEGLPELRRRGRDTYAQLLIALGRYEEAQEFMIDHVELLESKPNPSWYLLFEGLSYVQLLRHYHRWDDAARLARRIVSIADSRSNPWLGTHARIAAVEPLLRLGRRDDATQFVAEAEMQESWGSLGSLPEIALAKSFAFAAAGLHRIAARFAQTAVWASHAIGDVPKQTEASNALGAAISGDAQAARFDPRQPRRIRKITKIDSATRLTLSGPAMPQVADVWSVFAAAINPALMGQEVFALFYDSGCTEALALITRQDSKRAEILAYAGWGYRAASAAVASPKQRTVIDFGIFRNQRYELVVEPKRDLQSRCLAVAIEKLVRAALTLERLRNKEKEGASLWPLEDEIGADTHGVFVAASMTEILRTARRIAPTTLPVLLMGDTGTGKEILARAIHRSSARAARPFVPFNCTAVPRDMVESQLFGYRRGAFTGAQEAFPGVIRGAIGGTLFLDEIGDLSPDVQPKLLRFLETGEIQPLGDAQPIPIDVRVIAATNANLDKMVAEGRFREDLFYRLNVIRFRLPPLRERREEIPPLVHHFVRRFADEFRKGRIRLAEETMEYLLLYRWPGNVRQLENELRRVIALAEEDAVLTPAHLTPDIRESRRTVPPSEYVPTTNEMVVRVDQPLAAAVESLERQMVQRALELANGHVTEAAKVLGVSRKGLFLMRKRWGIGEKGTSVESSA